DIYIYMLLLLPPDLGATRRSHVYKHGLLELAGTLDCVGPRSPMAYVNYGCYCGLGGHGECCHHHDCCYSQAQDAGCSPKLDCYPWKYMDHVSCDFTLYFLKD
uniref:Phospholipase A2-like central domain-containing protein n=1 Tax=Mus spicilegus TaxID=10103 RepID=A0A8C6H734_MUSSI